MMAHSLQGIQQRHAPSGFPIQKPYAQTATQILQLDNMDSDTSPVRVMIQHKIVNYLKGRDEFCNVHPQYLVTISKHIDEQLYKEAESQVQYMDFETVDVRSNTVLSRASFRNSRYSRPSAVSLPVYYSEPPGIKVIDSSIQHGRTVPGSINLSLPTRDISDNVLHPHGFAPNGHHKFPANFARSSAESLAMTMASPSMSALPECSPSLAGDFSSGVHTFHTKDHLRGDAHQVDTPQPSTSGSSTSLSAMHDQSANSANDNQHSTGQVPSLLQYGKCDEELYTRSNPIEQSDHSNITAGGHVLSCLYDQSKMRQNIKGDYGLDKCMQMNETCSQVSDCQGFSREKCSNLNTKFSHNRCLYMADSGECGSVRERVERSEQTSNSTVSKPTSPTSDESSGKRHPAKRLKANFPSPVYATKVEYPKEQQPAANEIVYSETVQSETTELPTKSPSGCSLGDSNVVLGLTNEDLHSMDIVRLPETVLKAEEELGDVEMEDYKLNSVDPTSVVASLGSMKKRGASVLHALTADELRDHMRSLNQHTCPSKVATEETHSGLPDQNTCNLCGMERLLFEPPPRFCALCFKIINSTGSYYVHVENGNDKASICGKCHHLSTAKAKYQKRFSYAETDAEPEWWVACDKCKAWQHQICALFNPKLVEEEAEYTCAKCLLKEKDSGDINLLESSTVLGALELPRTKLSDHIEQRLSGKLEEERKERLRKARDSGKGLEEVPGVEGLTVRVVSSAARVLQVQPRFRDFFKEGKYPGEFPYKSKAILLFQKNEGVDVCLFAMYVQEYGSDSPLPNRRHVYLAYIDSVKYFRPEIKSASGEALRTFVYHEILIGYLEYCKKQGFVSCSIWACPSTKRDDYVLYCHPTSQKMPKSDKLRSWYQNLVKKAVQEKVVVERNTLYDFFLQPTSECKASISAACLPYCENDFWPGEAERLLEKKDDKTSQKIETQVGRILRVAKREVRKGNLEDMLLVHKLGEKMRTMKEDFIMLCLRHFCKHCHQPIVSGKSWVCKTCKSFHLCDKCHANELSAPQKDRHPATTKQKHEFDEIEEELLPETDDGDPTMESKYFDSRIDFLKHCQDNQYQFDTLRRAKHSTMMILYHLHDSACSACHRSMDQCLAWRCLVCLGCKYCDSCYKQGGENLHIHKLKQTDSRYQLPNYTLQDYLEGLVHASKCFYDPRNCTFKLCIMMKKLFFHGVRCDIRNRGGCRKCIFMWKLLLTHSKHCHHEDCSVPRCRDIKAFMGMAKVRSGAYALVC